MGLLTVGAMWFAAVGMGAWILDRSRSSSCFPSFWQRFVLSALVGWIVLSLATLLLGLVGLCNPLALGVLLISLAAWGLQGWAGIFRSASAAGRDASSPADFEFSRWVLVLLLLLYALAIPYALTPSIESDELRYHLAAPESYLDAGRIAYLPHQAMANFPFLMEMLYTMAMALQGTEAAHLIHLSFLESSAVLVALLSFLLIRFGSGASMRMAPRTRRTIASIAGVTFAAIPSVTVLGSWAFVDLGSVAYFLAVVYLGALALVGHRRPPAWLIGMMAGGAIGTKYSMLPLMALVAALFLLLDFRRIMGGYQRASSLRRYAMEAVLTAALIASPWMIKSALWTGNPVYPLAYGVLGGEDWSDDNAAFYSGKTAEKGYLPFARIAAARGEPRFPIDRLPGPLARGAEFLISPVTTSLQGGAFEGAVLGPMPLMAMALLGFGLLARWMPAARRPLSPRAPPLLQWVFGLIVVTWVFWFFTYQSYRILLPSLALIFAAAGWGAAAVLPGRATEKSRPFDSAPLSALIAGGALYSWLVTFVIIVAFKQPAPLPLALGFGTREQYLDSALSYYRSAGWLEVQTSPRRRALLIGEHRTLYFPPDVVASDWFDTPQPLPFIRATEDNEELLDMLLEADIGYICFNNDEMRKFASIYLDPRTAKSPRFSSREYARFRALMIDSRLRLVHRDERYDIFVYEIQPRETDSS